MRCGLGPHQVENGCHITEPHYVKFVRRAIVDFRPQTEVCQRCKNSVALMYARKRKSLRMKLRALSTVESLSSSDGKSNPSADDTLDNLLREGPRYKTLRSLRSSLRGEQASALSPLRDRNHQTPKPTRKAKSPGSSSSSSSSSNNLPTLAALANSEPFMLGDSIAPPNLAQQQNTSRIDGHRRSRTTSTSSVVTVVPNATPGVATAPPPPPPPPPTKTPRAAKPKNASTKPAKVTNSTRRSKDAPRPKSPEPMPSTSAAALARQANATTRSPAQPVPHVAADSSSDDSSDGEELLNTGINVLRGVRLPHVQPASRKRPFTSDNPQIMDIYLQGTTGG